MKKRILSVLLCLVMVLSLMPTVAFAAAEDVSFADLPETGFTSITVPSGDYYTGQEITAAFINFLQENGKPDGKYVLIDYYYIDNSGYHMSSLTVADNRISSSDGGFSDSASILFAMMNDSTTDWWINGTFSADYPVWVNNERFTSDKLSIGCGSGTATLDVTTTPYTLTLNNATITKVYSGTMHPAAVYSEKDLMVILEGDNAITLASDDVGCGFRTDSGLGLTLTGDGNLDIRMGNLGFEGINSAGSLTVDMSGSLTVNVSGSALKADSKIDISGSGNMTIDSAGHGIMSGGVVTISGDGNLTINAGNYGIRSFRNGVTISGDGDLTVTSSYNGISTFGNIIFSGSGAVTVTAGEKAVQIDNSGCSLLLEGTGTPISLTGGTGHSAVYNVSDGNSPVGGTKLAYYNDVIGKPDGQSVVYNHAYGITVNGTTVTSDNKANVLSDGAVSYDPAADKLNISAFSGDLTIVGNDTVDIEINNAVDGYFIKIKNVNDVTISAAGNPIIGDAEITCTGNITSSGLALMSLNVDSAKAITVTGNYPDRPVISGVSSIASSGDVLIQNIGGGKVFGGGFDYHRLTGFGDYCVKEGDTVSSLSVIEARREDDYFDIPFEKSVFYVCVPEKYDVTFCMNNHGTAPAAQKVNEGEKAIKPADPTASDWTFDGWYADDTFSAAFDFDTVISADTVIYAKWTYSGGSSAPANNTVTYDDDGSVTIPLSGGKQSVNVSASVIGSTAIVKDIKDADLAKVLGGENVEIDLTGLNKTIDTVKIPTNIVEKIAVQGGMSVRLSTATVSFDAAAMQTVSGQAKGNTIELVVDGIREVSLNEAQREALKDLNIAFVIDANLSSNGIHLCSENKGGFGGGKVTVTLPFEIKDSTAKYSVYYVDDNGKLEKLNAGYDAKNKCFVFELEHFSNYVVAYNENAAQFVDVPVNAYYYDAVQWAAEMGIIFGVDDVRFDPNGTCTRAQAVTFLWRAAGCPQAAVGDTFTDIVKGSYYEKAVAWALANGITSGTSATTFSPDADCTRAQIVSFLYHANKVDTLNIKNNPFTDVKDGTYYYNAVLWAAEKEITNGTTETTFSPDANCTRAQIVTFLYRFMNK